MLLIARPLVQMKEELAIAILRGLCPLLMPKKTKVFGSREEQAVRTTPWSAPALHHSGEHRIHAGVTF